MPPANRRYDRRSRPRRYRRHGPPDGAYSPRPALSSTKAARWTSSPVPFEREYERLFRAGLGAGADAGIELVNYGVDGVGVVDKARPLEEGAPHSTDAPASMRDVIVRSRQAIGAAPRAAGLFDGPGLPPGTEIAGPAAIEHSGTTDRDHGGPEAPASTLSPHPHHHRQRRKGGRDGRQ